jgi:hypothetical protein
MVQVKVSDMVRVRASNLKNSYLWHILIEDPFFDFNQGNSA